MMRHSKLCGVLIAYVASQLKVAGSGAPKPTSNQPDHTWLLTDAGTDEGNWRIDSESLNVDRARFSIEQKVVHGGKQEGSKVITISSADGLTIVVSPTRGMGILHVEGGGTRLGWDSPVDEVVNPANINLERRNGLGWLDGFNEMMVRCGYEWTGHPVTENGTLYTLHGRAGNTTASKVEVTVGNEAPHEIRIRGLLKEYTFKNAKLETWTELRYVPGSKSFTVHDTLTNRADYTHEYQIIYHSNFGTPILEEEARFIAPVKEISPFNDYARKGLQDWQIYLGPTRDFDEMVYNITPYADDRGWTTAALVNRAEDKGVSIWFDTHQLPLLTLWKNTDTTNQGYVTGIEPGTNYAYPVTIEREQGRVRELQPGHSVDFTLTYTLLDNAEEVQRTKRQVQEIQRGRKTTVTETPIAAE